MGSARQAVEWLATWLLIVAGLAVVLAAVCVMVSYAPAWLGGCR
jgi:hypothetical protein